MHLHIIDGVQYPLSVAYDFMHALFCLLFIHLEVWYLMDCWLHTAESDVSYIKSEKILIITSMNSNMALM